MKKLVVLGDLHNRFKEVSKYLEPDTIYLQTGDFGYFPHLKELEPVENLKMPSGSKMYTCMGNHENWDELDKFGYNVTELAHNVFYCPFGTELTLKGLNFLFLGKADSPDKNRRIQGLNWWPQEIPSYQDCQNVNLESKIDIVISHTVPYLFETMNDFPDPTRNTLDKLFVIIKPKLWYAGHFHRVFQGMHTSDFRCLWKVLNLFPEFGWMQEIK